MALIAVAADKGAPGVTTTAVALAAVWPRPVLLAECDPAGGDLVYRLPSANGSRLDPRRGLLSLAVAARRGLEPGQVWEHAQKLRGGLDVLVGVTNADQGSGLDPLWGQVGAALAGMPDADVIADCGRISSEGRYYDLLARADAVVMITRASLGDMVRIRDRVSVVDSAVRRRNGQGRVSVLVIANYKSFSAALGEVKQVLSGGEWPAPILGGIAYEPRSAELLSGEWGGKLDKSLLIRTAREVAGELSGQLAAAAPAVGRPAPAGPQAPIVPPVQTAPPVPAMPPVQTPPPMPAAHPMPVASEPRREPPWASLALGRDEAARREPEIVRPPDPARADPAQAPGSGHWPQQRPLTPLPPAQSAGPVRPPHPAAPEHPAQPVMPDRTAQSAGPRWQAAEPTPASAPLSPLPPAAPAPPTLPYQRPVPLRAVPELPAPDHRNQAYPPRPDYAERADGSDHLVNREGYSERGDYSARRDYPRNDEYPAPPANPEEPEYSDDLIPGLQRGPSGDGGRPAGRGRHAGGAPGSVTAEPGRR